MKPWLIPALALAAATNPVAAQDPPLPPDHTASMYLADDLGSQIGEFDRDGGFIRSFTVPGLVTPRGTAVDERGSLAVVSSGNSRILRIDLDGNLLQTITHPDLSSGTGISRSPTGEWFAGNFTPGGVLVFDASWNHLFTLRESGMNGVNCIAFDPGGAFAVSAAFSNQIFRFDAAGNLLGKVSHPSMLSPMSIALDSAGNHYVSGGASGRVTKFDISWNYLLDFGATGLGAPQGVVVDENDRIRVSDFSSDQIRKFDTAGNLLASWPHSGLSRVRNFAFQSADFALAREGAVAGGVQPRPAAVLTVNGSGGDRLGRIVLASTDAVQIQIDASPAGPSPAGFVLYAVLAPLGPADVETLSNGGGLMAFATPLSGGAPLVLVNSLGAPGLLGSGQLSAITAPGTVLTLPNGIGMAGEFTLQAILLDAGSAAGAGSPYSATNAVTLQVN